MTLRSTVVALLACSGLSACTEDEERSQPDPEPSQTPARLATPRELTCPSELRSVSAPPYFDEAARGAPTPEEALDRWLGSPIARGLGPDYVFDDDRNYAWVLRGDGTAEARVHVKLTSGGGYFYYGHEACGSR